MPEALENIDKIVAYCDALMVAWGDLGVELPAHEVPLVQKNWSAEQKQLVFQLLLLHKWWKQWSLPHQLVQK
jgi:hypothetical protein